MKGLKFLEDPFLRLDIRNDIKKNKPSIDDQIKTPIMMN